MMYVCMMKNREGGIDRSETFSAENDQDAYDTAVMMCAESTNSPIGGAEVWNESRLVRALTLV